MRQQSLRAPRVIRATPVDPSSGAPESGEIFAQNDMDTKRIFAAAMAGEFVCTFCSHPGPHDDIGHGQGSEIAFACAQCGKHLDEAALKRSLSRKPQLVGR
jgi:hypothetical protein